MAKDSATKQDAGQELAPWDAGEAPAMIEPTPELVEAAYAAIFDGQLPPEIGDPSVTARAIQERIRNETTFDGVFNAGSLPGWQDYTDEPVVVHAFHLNPANFDGQSVYAVVEIGVLSTGELKTVSCGGGNVLTQLVKAWENNWLPCRLVLRAKPTSTPGRTTLWLEKA